MRYFVQQTSATIAAEPRGDCYASEDEACASALLRARELAAGGLGCDDLVTVRSEDGEIVRQFGCREALDVEGPLQPWLLLAILTSAMPVAVALSSLG